MKLNLHDPKTRQRVLIGAAGLAAVIAYLIVRHGATASTTAPAATPVADPTIDPATGLPYALEQSGLGSGDLSGGGDGGSNLGVTADTPDLSTEPGLLPADLPTPAEAASGSVVPPPEHLRKRPKARPGHHARPPARRHPRGQHQHDGPHAQHKHRADRARTKPRVKPPKDVRAVERIVRRATGVHVPPPPKAPLAVAASDGAVRGHPPVRKRRRR